MYINIIKHINVRKILGSSWVPGPGNLVPESTVFTHAVKLVEVKSREAN